MKKIKAKFSKKNVEKAIIGSMGILSAVASKLKCDWHTAKKYIDMYDLHEKLEEENQVALDFAESQLYRNIKEQDNTAIIFFLKCKGKKRGYVEKQEIDVKSKNVITYIDFVDFEKLEDD